MVVEYLGPLIAAAKKIREIAGAIKNKELNDAVIQLQEITMELQTKGMEQEKEKERLSREVEALNEQLQIKADLVFEDEAYWNKEESADGRGPFCPKCWTVDKKIVHLARPGDSTFRPKCPNCNNHYSVKM